MSFPISEAQGVGPSSLGKHQREDSGNEERSMKRQKQLAEREELMHQLRQQAASLRRFLPMLRIPNEYKVLQERVALLLPVCTAIIEGARVNESLLKTLTPELLGSCSESYILADKSYEFHISCAQKGISEMSDTVKRLLQEEPVPSSPKTPVTRLVPFEETHPKDKNHDSSALSTITRIENAVRPHVRKYVENNPRLPLFELPENASQTFKDLINGMEIPVVVQATAIPSLLLHELGRNRGSIFTRRLQRIFGQTVPIRFLCNTSGSGKTRLLFEGLWRDYGFYFTASTGPDFIGSSDVSSTLDSVRWHLQSLQKDGENGEALEHNLMAARRRFLVPLLVRFVIFRIFLQYASKSPTGLTQEHPGRWLLLQVASTTLVGLDIFDFATKLVKSTPLHVLEEAIALEQLEVLKIINQPIHCVLDEAQRPASMYEQYFRFDVNPSQSYQILREIVLAWKRFCPFVIISGTVMPTLVLEEAVSSAVGKFGPLPELFTDVGAFDDSSVQRMYLEQYLPPGFLDDRHGEELAFRVKHWLCGRHRFTATYLTCLLMAGFDSPHEILNNFVQRMSNCRPTDRDGPSPIEEMNFIRGFDFSRLQAGLLSLELPFLEPMVFSDDALRRILANFVFDHVFDGKSRPLDGPDDSKFVEYGFARFAGSGKPVLDEPLPLLAAMRHFTATPWSMSHFVSEMMTHPDGTVQVAFERFGSYLLAKKFASFTSIADIFGDNIPNTLKDKKARLVSIRKRSNLTIRHPLDITSPDWPTYRLGSKCSKYEEVLSWCEDPAGTAFCFPPSHMGLDLILILELESEGTLVAALVQFNQLTQLYMTQVQTKSAINAVDPNLFYVPREPEAKESTEANKRREEINQALRSLLGTGFVPLRVCMAYSVMPNQSAIQKMNDPKEFYPVAIANLQSLATTSEETKTLQSLVQKLQVAIMQ